MRNGGHVSCEALLEQTTKLGNGSIETAAVVLDDDAEFVGRGLVQVE
jgi:hypothetical protein